MSIPAPISTFVSLSLAASLIMACALSYAGPPPKDKSLPPGLAKKAEQGKPLPPGWQKKLARGAILDPHIYSHGVEVVPIDRDGLVTIRVDGEIIRLVAATREIVDILSR